MKLSKLVFLLLVLLLVCEITTATKKRGKKCKKGRKCKHRVRTDSLAGATQVPAEIESAVPPEPTTEPTEPPTVLTTEASEPNRTLLLVAALPEGEAYLFWYNTTEETGQVMMIDEQGKIYDKDIYSCEGCTGVEALMEVGEHLYVVHGNGTLVQINVTMQELEIYNIANVSLVTNKGWSSQFPEPAMLPNTDLVLVDAGYGEVFSYTPSTQEKVIRATGLQNPTSVSYIYHDAVIYFAVCEPLSDNVLLYNYTWNLVTVFGQQGSADGELSHPPAAIMTMENKILVADRNNHRVSEFDINGKFTRHVVDKDLISPLQISLSEPYLWVVHGNQNLYRYNIDTGQGQDISWFN